jgi:hypothetical protein
MKTRALLIACRHLQEIYNRTGSSNENGQILDVKANLQKTIKILGAESKYHIAQISLQPCLCDKHLADADMACVNGLCKKCGLRNIWFAVRRHVVAEHVDKDGNFNGRGTRRDG